MATIGLSRTVSETDGDFSRKSQNIRTPLYFVPRLKGSPLELAIGAVSQKTSDGATGPTKKFDDIFSRVDRMHQRDGRTDRPTDGHRATAKTALTHSVAR